jgi:hypothetical protein
MFNVEREVSQPTINCFAYPLFAAEQSQSWTTDYSARDCTASASEKCCFLFLSSLPSSYSIMTIYLDESKKSINVF